VNNESQNDTNVASEPMPMAYTLKAAAKVAGLSPFTLYMAVTEGKLRARKAGKRWLILRQDLESFLVTLEVVSPSQKWLEKRRRVAV